MSLEKVLIVDDDPNMTKLLNILLKTDYEVEISHTVKEALQKTEHGGYDSIIIDLNIPNESGYELIEKVRENTSLRWLPIIVLSGKEKSEDRIKSFELGADDYLTKPFNPSELKLRLSLHLKKYQLLKNLT